MIRTILSITFVFSLLGGLLSMQPVHAGRSGSMALLQLDAHGQEDSASAVLEENAPEWASIVPDAEERHRVFLPSVVSTAEEEGAAAASTQAQVTAAAAVAVSDDFNSCTIDDGLWTAVDPVGDSSFAVNGSQLLIGVPAGSVHDVWYAGNESARLMQPVTDADFQVEVKFESDLNAAYQLQGLLIEQDGANFVRLDFYSTAYATYLFAATFTNGSPSVKANFMVTTHNVAPLYLRATRVGDEFTLDYSLNGSDWTQGAAFTHALSVAQIGPFAGNAGNAPAHSAQVDYFFDTAAPIVPEDGDSFSSTLTLSPPANGTIEASPNQTTFGCGETVELTPVPDAGWRFDGWGGDAAGSDNPLTLVMDGDKTVTASFVGTQEYTLTVDTVGGGSVQADPSQSTYYEGQDITLTATPDAGWQFAGWSGDLSGASPSTVLTILGDSTVTATFDADTAAPVISDIVVAPADNGATINFTTNEPTTARVDYGETTGYELGNVQSSVGGTSHSLTLENLASATVYQYQITVEDGSGNVTTSANGSFQTTEAPSGPQIEVWYGDTQFFGQQGIPQNWVNILGNVSSPNGVAALSYTLNDGPTTELSIGPDTRRLAQAGDFNADLAVADLDIGANTVAFTAEDGAGNQSVRQVTVNFAGNGPWPLPYTIDWGSAAAIQDVAQVVDGEWTIENGSLRPAVLAYDRLVAIGDRTWTDYEVTVPVTLHAIDADGFEEPSNGPALGFILRWQGHTDTPMTSIYQPKSGWMPMGALGWYRWASPGWVELQIAEGDGIVLDTGYAGAPPAFDTQMMMKMRVETVAGGSVYSLKVWPANTSEPAAWDAVGQTGASSVGNGSVLLVAHHVVASFGDVTVTPLSAASYGLTTETTGNGTVTVDPDLSVYEAGASVTLTATPDAGWAFAGWSGDLTGSDNPAVVTMDGNKTIGAIFEAVPSGEPSTVRSDDFASCALDSGLWTVVDSVGDGAVLVQAGRLELAVPAGTGHDVWSSGNNSLRIMQPANDTDFELEVKFESGVEGAYALQGLLVEQDAGNLLRFDFHSDGTITNLFAAHFADGTASTVHNAPILDGSPAPLYMRVRRVGDQWTQFYSQDGQNWTQGASFTHSVSVSAVGVFAGNAVNNPAHTALVDYFFNTAAPITPEDGDPPQFAVSVTSTGAGTVALASGPAGFSCGSDVTLTATPNEGWSFTGWGSDLSGSENPATLTLDGDRSVTATFVE